jgi:hypothetical protein
VAGGWGLGLVWVGWLGGFVFKGKGGGGVIRWFVGCVIFYDRDESRGATGKPEQAGRQAHAPDTSHHTDRPTHVARQPDNLPSLPNPLLNPQDPPTHQPTYPHTLLIPTPHSPKPTHPPTYPSTPTNNTYLSPVGRVAGGLDGVDPVERIVGKGHGHEVTLHRAALLPQPHLRVELVAARHLFVSCRAVSCRVVPYVFRAAVPSCAKECVCVSGGCR